MGRFIAGEADLTMDDRALRHVQLAVTSALAVGESFFLGWREDRSTGMGRTSVWISPASRYRFEYERPWTAEINPRWVMALRLAASKSTGMTVFAEADIPPGFGMTQRPAVAQRANAGRWGPLASQK